MELILAEDRMDRKALLQFLLLSSVMKFHPVAPISISWLVTSLSLCQLTQTPSALTYSPLPFCSTALILMLQFEFRFSSDHTASLCLAAERRREPPAPSVILGELIALTTRWSRAASDCWYWEERSAPGAIHQKWDVCTVGIDMNNPCFLYPFLCNFGCRVTSLSPFYHCLY